MLLELIAVLPLHAFLHLYASDHAHHITWFFVSQFGIDVVDIASHKNGVCNLIL